MLQRPSRTAKSIAPLFTLVFGLTLAGCGTQAEGNTKDPAGACGLDMKTDETWRTYVDGTGLAADGAYEFVFASADDAQNAAEAQSQEASASAELALEYVAVGFVMTVPEPKLSRVLLLSEDAVGVQRGCDLVGLFDAAFRRLGFSPLRVHALDDPAVGAS